MNFPFCAMLPDGIYKPCLFRINVLNVGKMLHACEKKKCLKKSWKNFFFWKKFEKIFFGSKTTIFLISGEKLEGVWGPVQK